MARKRTVTDPRFPRFWEDEEGQLWDEVAPTALRIILFGGQAGTEALPSGVRVLVDWDRFNQHAVDWLHRYRFDWIRGINETSRQQTISTIDQWIRDGERLEVLEAKLAPVFGEQRASRIAATEVTRIFEGGHQAAWESSGVVDEFIFETSVDDLVCPLCAPLNGQVFDLRDTEHTPPIHVGCRCRRQPKVSEGKFRESVRDILNEGEMSARPRRWWQKAAERFTVVKPDPNPELMETLGAMRALLDELKASRERVEPYVIQPPEIPAPVVHVAPAQVVVNVPEQPAPIVNVAPPQVIVNVPEQAPPIVQVEAPQVTVQVPAQPAPVVNVEQPQPPAVTVELPEPKPAKFTVKRNASGQITGITEE